MPAFNRNAVLEQLDGDEEFMAEMIGLFLEHLPQRLTAIDQARRSGDLEALSRAAHTMKSAVGNMAAEAALVAFQQLEQSARDGDGSSIAERCDRAVNEASRLEAELRQAVGA